MLEVREHSELFGGIDKRLSTYVRSTDGYNWKEASNMVPVIPGFAAFESERLNDTCETGRNMPDQAINALSFQRRNLAANPQELRSQFVMLIGMAQKAKSEGNDQLFMKATLEAQKIYAVYQHALRAIHNERFCDENGFKSGDVNPVFQVGHPALNLKSEQWNGNLEDANREVNKFDKAQVGLLGVHTSRNERSSILGDCQITGQKEMASKLPPRIVSIVFPYQDIVKSTVVFNPVMKMSDVVIPTPLTDGWYGKFDGRIFNQVPAWVEIEGKVWDRENKSLVDGSVRFDSTNKTIIITEGSTRREMDLKNNADMATMRLVMDLLDGIPPLDRFEEMPREFGKDIKDRNGVVAPGVFHDLAHYYGAASKAVSALELAAINGRQMVERGMLKTFRILEGGGLAQESGAVAAIHGRHIIEGAGLVGHEVVAGGPEDIVDFCFGMGPLDQPIPFELTGLSRRKKEATASTGLRLA